MERDIAGNMAVIICGSGSGVKEHTYDVHSGKGRGTANASEVREVAWIL